MSKRAILYARVSGDDRQNVTSSIDGQLELCRDYASKKGYKIIGEHSIVNRWEMRARLLIDGDNSLVTAFFARVGQPVNA